MTIIFNSFPHFWLIQYMGPASCFFGQCRSEQLLPRGGKRPFRWAEDRPCPCPGMSFDHAKISDLT